MNGVNCVAVRGGGIDHIRQYLQRHNYHKDTLNHYILLIGGNDLDGGSAFRVATDLENLVYDIKQANQESIVITGTILPRRGKFDDEEAYIEKVFQVDSILSQWSITHHHFLVDTFFGTSVGGAVKLRKEFFVPDLVHLSASGRETMMELIQFLVMSIEKDDYGDRFVWGDGETTRVAMWKF